MVVIVATIRLRLSSTPALQPVHVHVLIIAAIKAGLAEPRRGSLYPIVIIRISKAGHAGEPQGGHPTAAGLTHAQQALRLSEQRLRSNRHFAF